MGNTKRCPRNNSGGSAEAHLQTMQRRLATLNDPVGAVLEEAILNDLVTECEGLLLWLLQRHTIAIANKTLSRGGASPACSWSPLAPEIEFLAGNGVRITLAHLLPDGGHKDGRTSRNTEQLWAELYYRPIAQALSSYTPSERMVIWYVHAYSQATPWNRIPDNDHYKTRPFTNILTKCAGIDDNPDRLVMTLSSSRWAQPDEGDHTEILLVPFDERLTAVSRELGQQQLIRFNKGALTRANG